MNNNRSIFNILALALAGAASLFTLLYLFNTDSHALKMLATLGIPMSLVSYVLGGGFGNAFRSAMKVGKWGWLIVPFPIDLVVGLMTTVLAIYFFFGFPIIFVAKSVLGRTKGAACEG